MGEEGNDLTKGKASAYYDGVLKRYDQPRADILAKANEFITAGKGKTCVYYRYTCAKCNARCGFNEPNVLYDVGICSNCGTETIIEEAGFMSVTELEPKRKKATHKSKSGKGQL